ncbi:phosphatase PAP2 family protein [Microbacterium sp. H1-D42]|uniref:phosphatase PAP2 family protein n=1 Tax=Microbacterium sp. H1-D42 TaxID=2925844 RepID=UPI001F53C9BF|nr:phosphatase PAP2 family protein [Microbacterium sp. H1-D42]UNK71357.1 phosphatase PAP2 family protein [Microbacterium sp. H1-D42]
MSGVQTPPRNRTLLWVGLGLLLILVLQGAAILAAPEAPWTQALDDAWRAAVGAGPDDAVATGPIAMLFQEIGAIPGFALMMLILPAALAIVGRWRSMLFVIAAQLAGPGLVSQLAKNIVDRPRPAEDAAAGLFGPLVMVDHGSFPSGHSMSMGVIIVTIFALIPPTRRTWRIVWAVISVLLTMGMIWQRTLINAHWFSDTVVGILAGMGVALVLWWAFWPWLNRDYGRRPWFLKPVQAPATASAA